MLGTYIRFSRFMLFFVAKPHKPCSTKKEHTYDRNVDPVRIHRRRWTYSDYLYQCRVFRLHTQSLDEFEKGGSSLEIMCSVQRRRSVSSMPNTPYTSRLVFSQHARIERILVLERCELEQHHVYEIIHHSVDDVLPTNQNHYLHGRRYSRVSRFRPLFEID